MRPTTARELRRSRKNPESTTLLPELAAEAWLEIIDKKRPRITANGPAEVLGFLLFIMYLLD